MYETEARITTSAAVGFLTELADNWRHRYPVRVDAMTGEVELPGALLVVTADAYSLTLRLSSEDRHALERAQESVATHVDHVFGEDAGVRGIWQSTG
jgi:hypothetical protein